MGRRGELHCEAIRKALAKCSWLYRNLWIAVWVAKKSKTKVPPLLCFQNATLLPWHYMMGSLKPLKGPLHCTRGWSPHTAEFTF